MRPAPSQVFWRVKRLEFSPGEGDLKELKKARAENVMSWCREVLQVLQSFIKHAKQGGTRVPPIPEGAGVRTARWALKLRVLTLWIK